MCARVRAKSAKPDAVPADASTAPAVQLGRVEQRHAGPDDPVLLQPLDPPPARRGRQADPVRDLGHGEGGILLQASENLAVDAIHWNPISIFRIGLENDSMN